MEDAPMSATNAKTAVQEQFGAAAAEYAVSPVHVGGPDLDAMVAASGLGESPSPVRLLDVGTGAGHTAFAFAPRVEHVEALDLTQQMLDQVARGAAERGLANVHCRLGDAESLPYPDSFFDVVTSRLCAHHFEDVPAFVREAARVLKPGGAFLLVDSLAAEDALKDTFFNAFELLRDPSHVRNYSRSQWHAMLGADGFDSETLGDWMLVQPFEDWVERIGTPPTGVAHLRFLFESAHPELRREFEIVTDESGVLSVGIPCGLIRGRLR
jgi:ubiquinone/menaquinone biosynthesis C-methylase UbiE